MGIILVKVGEYLIVGIVINNVYNIWFCDWIVDVLFCKYLFFWEWLIVRVFDYNF